MVRLERQRNRSAIRYGEERLKVDFNWCRHRLGKENCARAIFTPGAKLQTFYLFLFLNSAFTSANFSRSLHSSFLCYSLLCAYILHTLWGCIPPPSLSFHHNLPSRLILAWLCLTDVQSAAINLSNM